MEVKVAKTAGFCFGVKRAVDKVYEEIEAGRGPIYTYGPIIHNEEVVKDLEEKGVRVIHSLEDIKALEKGTVIIRSHGAAKAVSNAVGANGLRLVDATCPFVKKIQGIVAEESAAGNFVIIIGNPEHPEVQGIRGWAGTDTVVINSEEEADNLTIPEGKNTVIVSQTTFNYKKFEYLVEKFSKKGYDIKVLNTICNATHERQVEAQKIAGEVDAMIVIGGRNSSNTQKLFEICKGECDNTYYIQTLVDLDKSLLSSIGIVGITAGASTPNKIIEEVLANVRAEF